MKRNYPSGWDKKKRREETNKYIATLPKVSHFFTVSRPPPPVDTNNVEPEIVALDSEPGSSGLALAWDNDKEIQSTVTDLADSSVELMEEELILTECQSDDDEDGDVVSRPNSASPLPESDHESEDAAELVLDEDPALWPTDVR